MYSGESQSIAKKAARETASSSLKSGRL